MNETFLHTVSLNDDLSEIDSIELNKIALNRARYGFRYLASNGSHFWTLQLVPCTSYESGWYDFRLIGFSQNAMATEICRSSNQFLLKSS